MADKRNSHRGKKYDAKGHDRFKTGAANKRSNRGSDSTMDYPQNDQRRGMNDVSWYSKYPQLLEAAAKFPFPYRPGMNMPMFSGNYATKTSYDGKYMIPGAMVLSWMPTIGRSQDNTDPASVVGKEIYAKVRASFSGALEADAPDFVIYLMALDSVFTYIAWLKRVYRVLTAWNADNYATPDLLLHGMGFSDQEISALRIDRTKLWQLINELVLQTRKFTCPASMDIMNRHYWMSDNVYTDAPDINAQFYMFNLRAVYRYGEVNTPDGVPAPGLLVSLSPTYVIDSTRNVSVEGLYSFGLSLIQALVDWDDAYTISGYLQRAFEGTQNFIVSELGPNEAFIPVYETEVLSQIENSMTIPFGDVFNRTDTSTTAILNGVYQDPKTNAVLCNPRIILATSADTEDVYKSMAYNAHPFINSREVVPTVVGNVIATRLKCVVAPVTLGTGSDPVYTGNIQCATEIPICWEYYNTANFTLTDPTREVKQYLVLKATDDVSSVYAGVLARRIMALAYISAFDWKPFTHLFYVGGTNASPNVTGYNLSGDVHNITVLSNSELANLHKVCLFSEFNAFSFV